MGGPSPTRHLAPLPPPHMGWGVGRGSTQPNHPKQELVSMVTRVPGGRGCSRSSCPPEHPTQAPEPQLMPTQHPPLPICLLGEPAWTARRARTEVPTNPAPGHRSSRWLLRPLFPRWRTDLPPSLCTECVCHLGTARGRVGSSKPGVPRSSPSKPVLTCFHPEKFHQYFVSSVSTSPS